MLETLSSDAKQAIVAATDYAMRHGHGKVTPSHLLLGLLVPTGSLNGAVRVLKALDVSPAELHRAMIDSMTDGVTPPATKQFDERALQVMSQALREAQRCGSSTTSAEHLLFGIVREGTSCAAQALVRVDATLERVHDNIQRLHDVTA